MRQKTTSLNKNKVKEQIENTLKGFTENGKMSEHCLSENYGINWNEANIIQREQHFCKQNNVETSFIKLADRLSVNLQLK